jgi:putative radical SAM enzyme (TIGR03279 family)
MPHRIAGVAARSPAERAGVAAGDLLLALNGQEIVDWIDYQALSAERRAALSLARDGRALEIVIDKGEYQALGLSFETQLMSPVRMCANKCGFCFVDQLPPNCRESLRMKDDDWRLSLMMGAYVTLTNVSGRELKRIAERRASPLYISVHTTDEALRAEMLGLKRSDGIIDKLKFLTGAGICFHTQAVLCPGLNDGLALQKTVEDLAGLAPHCLSLALVPVGLTAHRAGLAALRGYDAEGAGAILSAADAWQARYLSEMGTRFAYAADEFYVLAGIEPPQYSAYEGFSQIENGVGMMRLLEYEYNEAYGLADLSRAIPKRRTIATGAAAAGFIANLMTARPLPGVNIDVITVKNRFFGESVTVAGLIAGRDLIGAARGLNTDEILITACMLREGEDVFLDGITLEEARAATGKPIITVGRRGEDLLRALMGTRAPLGAL